MFKPISNIISTFNLTHPEKLKQIDVFAGESRAAIAVYMTLQWMRTKEFRTGMVQLYEQAPLKMLLKTKLGDDVRNVLENSKLELSDKNYIHFLHNKFIFDNNDTLQEISSDFLTNKIWYVAYNNGVKPFYTSDNPIVKYGHLGQHGIKNRGIEIVFPFNTKLALVLRDRELFCHDIKKDNRYVSIDNDFVDFYNSLQVGQSYRYIFSKTNEFSVAQKMLLRNPNLKNIDRNRFSIN